MATKYQPDPYLLGRTRAFGYEASGAAGRGNSATARRSVRDGRVLLDTLEGAYGRDHPKVKEARRELRAGSRSAMRSIRRQTRSASSRNAKSKKASSSYAGG